MEKIGNQKIWSYFERSSKSRPVANTTIRGGSGHTVRSYFDLARKVAELQFRNREHVLLFRGQDKDYRTTKGNSMLKAAMFRLNGHKRLGPKILATRFSRLRMAENELVRLYQRDKHLDLDRLKRNRILRWAILQHYEVCATPLLDVTHSLRIAASFASLGSAGEAYVFVLGVPNLSGAVTASSEANLQIVRLSSACPPSAIRPHIQEGYLLGEYPEIADIEQNAHYRYYEMDFGRRLVAKFRLDLPDFWTSKNYPRASEQALYPGDHRDPLLNLAANLRAILGPVEA